VWSKRSGSIGRELTTILDILIICSYYECDNVIERHVDREGGKERDRFEAVKFE
jgi:hypothetical protein